MSQKDDDDLRLQLQKAEAARAKSAQEWERLDSVLFDPDLQQAKKLYVLAHLRTANSQTGLMYARAIRFARAMSVKQQAARRMQRELRKDGILELIEPGKGGANTVKIAGPWLQSRLENYLEWKRSRSNKELPQPSEEGVTRSLEGPGPQKDPVPGRTGRVSSRGQGTRSLEGQGGCPP